MNESLLPAWCGVQMQSRGPLRVAPLIGLARQETFAGQEFLRLDIPACGRRQARTVYISPKMIEFIEVLGEEQAKAAQERRCAKQAPSDGASNS